MEDVQKNKMSEAFERDLQNSYFTIREKNGSQWCRNITCFSPAFEDGESGKSWMMYADPMQQRRMLLGANQKVIF